MTEYLVASRPDEGDSPAGEPPDHEPPDHEPPDHQPESGALDARRAALVAAAQGGWIDALTDLGGRNTLLYFKDRRAGTLDLGAADPVAVDKFLRTGSGRITRLFHDVDARADAIRRAQAIYRKARELEEERGIRVGFLATGMARWDELFLEPAAPVLLRGLTIMPTRARHDDFDLMLDEDYEVNPVLLHKLASVFGAATEDLAGAEPDRISELLTSAADDAEVPGFEITDRLVIGTFTYAKLPMVQDLQAAGELLAESDVVAAIAGDPLAQELLGTDPDLEAAPESPEQDFSVLDADSSQRNAINTVLAGRSLVIHGPPGTGKSQTIANLIAALVAEGRKVLFVAEKRAAIDAVLSRLKMANLGEVVLDIHEGAKDRLRIARELGDAMDEAQQVPEPDVGDLHRRLTDRHLRLSRHVSALHQPHQPWGLTPYQVQSALLGVPARCTHSDPSRQSRAHRQRASRSDQGRAPRVRASWRVLAAARKHAVVRRDTAHGRRRQAGERARESAVQPQRADAHRPGPAGVPGGGSATTNRLSGCHNDDAPVRRNSGHLSNVLLRGLPGRSGQAGHGHRRRLGARFPRAPRAAQAGAHSRRTA